LAAKIKKNEKNCPFCCLELRIAGEVSLYILLTLFGKTMTKTQLEENRIRIGLKIKEIREAKGFSQLDVAAVSGVARPHVARVENGKYNVGVDILTKIARAVGCKIEVVSCENTILEKGVR
jgi:DNA-binding XRE family transcriptional regulator